MSTNYSEQMFQSIDTIISQRLNEVSFDKTEICEIIEKNKDYPDKYWVSNEAGLKYEAYSVDNNKKYLVGTKVYVTIPQGNYEFRKLIIGRYSADEIPKNLYTNPFNNMIVSSQYGWEEKDNDTLSAAARKPENSADGKIQKDSIEFTGLTFHNSGLGQFNYIGLEFSATTGFGGTEGEFQIIIDLLDENHNTLLSDTEHGLLTFSSKQLYGNPYYLNSSLKFQHLFNFPVGNFSDLTKVKKISVTLVAKDNFNYSEEYDGDQKVTINNLTLYFGFDSSQDSMANNKLVLDLDNTKKLEYGSADNNGKAIVTNDDKKVMSIDWRNLDTNAIYNENKEQQYPEAGKYNIYWLQYCETVGYTIDIEESGTYWKTIQKENANAPEAYKYELTPNADWKKEQIKVIIKNNETNDYIESNGLTFTNTQFRTETGSNQGKQDTLKLTLAEGDDGIYNNYGIDNKLLSSYNNSHTITVNYIDNTKWDANLQKVIWRIPANATMIKAPVETVKNEASGKYETKLKKGWEEEKINNKVVNYIYTSSESDNAQTLTFNLSDQFSYNKTNNTISCHIIRYKASGSQEITDEYNGSITLQFGLQNTAGTGWSFNIVSDKNSLGYNDGNGDTMTLTAMLEDSEGNPINLTDDQKEEIEWSWYQIDDNNNYNLSQKNDNKTQATVRREKAYSYYAIVQATLPWTIANGTTNLTAYYPIAAGDTTDYLTGASRVVYNSNGTDPSYDDSKYWLSSDTDNKFIYEIIWPTKGTDSDENENKVFQIGEDGRLKPLTFLPTKPVKMAIVVKNGDTNVYVQPILVLQNGYQSKLLNEWNGQTNIDGKNNTILSALIGAGTKDKNNKFTGVLLGAIGQDDIPAKTGIYGMAEGVLRYKLDENGDFYVGTGDDAKIDFSGTGANKILTIAAKNFKLNTTNLTIDSDTGIILKNNGNKTVEFNINGTATIGGWSVGTASLSYANKDTSQQDYTRWLYFGQNDNAQIKWKNDETKNVALRLGNNFGVTSNGVLYASEAQIKGGNIGGWTINESILEKTLYEKDGLKVISRTGIQAGSNTDYAAFYAGCTTAPGGLIANPNITPFYVTHGGELYARKGKISGWAMGEFNDGSTYDNSLYSLSSDERYRVFLRASTEVGSAAFGVKDYDIDGDNKYKFYVSNQGYLYATDALIKGSIYANYGQIAGWNISSNTITKGGVTLSAASDATDAIRFKANNVFKVYNNGKVEMTSVSGGFLTIGNELTHPYASALNLAAGASNGIVFVSGIGIDQVGNSKGTIYSLAASNGEYPIYIKNDYGTINLHSQFGIGFTGGVTINSSLGVKHTNIVNSNGNQTRDEGVTGIIPLAGSLYALVVYGIIIRTGNYQTSETWETLGFDRL